MCILKRVVIEKLGPEGHTTLETDFDAALVLLTDEMARGYLIFSRDTQQRVAKQEDLESLKDRVEDSIRVMVIPPVAGG